MCVCHELKKNAARTTGDGSIMAWRGNEMWPSQGYCTKVIFIDYSSVMRTHELTCTVFHVCFHLSINASDVLTSVKFSQLT